MSALPPLVRLSGGDFQVHLAEPMKVCPTPVVARDALLERCRCAWGMQRGDDGAYRLANHSTAMSFRLEGPSGSGKNEIVYQLARELGSDLYTQRGHEDLSPEDLSLLLLPDRQADRRLPLTLRASPLATALLKGGLFFFDEIHRVPDRTLAALASVLDDRRELYSAATGLWIRAADEQAPSSFRFCCALDPSGGTRLPPYLEQRLTPAIAVPMPGGTELGKMVEWDVMLPADDVLAFSLSQERRERTEVEEQGELREKELLARLLRVQDEDRQRRFDEALAHGRAGRWQSAASAFEAIASELARSEGLRRNCENNLSHCLMELGHLKRALRICDALLERDPDFALAVCTRADILFERARRATHSRDQRRFREQSRAHYRRAHELPTVEAAIRPHVEARLAALESLETD